MQAKGSQDLLGPSTKRAIKLIQNGHSPAESGRYGTTNGAAMRIAPIGIAADITQSGPFLDTVIQACQVTHNTSLGIASAAAIAAVVSSGINGKKLEHALNAGTEMAFIAEHHGHWVAGGRIGPRIRWARKASLECDTDTIAAMLGAMLGACHGKGRFADLAREALNAEGIAMTLPPDPDKDTGVCVALTEASAERTFISCMGAEGGLSAEDLTLAAVQQDVWVYVSGYSLLQPDKARALLGWVLNLAPSVHVTFDPGPLIASLDPDLLNTLLPRINLWSSNRREANSFAPESTTLHTRLPTGCLIVVREGAQGCWISHPQGQQHIPGFKVQALDTNGAGDAHTGVMLATLAAGHCPAYAAKRANAAAALAVTRRGPATAPTAEQIDHFLQHFDSHSF